MKVGISHRWGINDGFVYNFPTGNGVFDIDLVFAEVYPPAQSKGVRIFDVSIEDTLSLKDFDVAAEGGIDKEIVKSFKNVQVKDDDLSIGFIKGLKENPMVSAIVIRSSDGSDFSLTNADGTELKPEETTTGEGVSKTKPEQNDDQNFDHQAHSVAGGPYIETDFNSDGEAAVKLDGSLSHSHYNNPKTGDSGKIVAYEWKADGEVLSTSQKFTHTFPIGTTNVQLKVTDQTGDFAFAPTQVKVLESTSGGAYCYYYLGATKISKGLNSEPKPDEGHGSDVIKFSEDTFPYDKKDGDGKEVAMTGKEVAWAMRCVANYISTTTEQSKFSVKYQGAGAQLFVDGGLKVQGQASEKGTKTISATITSGKGPVPIEVIYYKSTQTVSPILQFLVNNKIAPSSKLGFKASEIIPTISSISRDSVPPSGGGKLQIVGTGFFNGPTVKIGGVSPSITPISTTVLSLDSVPSQAAAGKAEVPVTVSNAAGVSNKVMLTYDANADEGIAWDQTQLLAKSGGKFVIKQITSIAIGPDSKYYMGSYSSYVYKLSVDKNLVVQDHCTSPSVGESRAILGIAFNYASKTFRVYVSTNSLYWNFGGPFANKADGWANGAIESFVAPGGCSNSCLCYEKKVVTGLPVSNHDHGVNAIVFRNNDMYISVGGNTNAGHNTPNNKLGGVPETALSGAILIAKTSKGAAFDGKIVYSNPGDPATAKVIGGDVSVHAGGLRNCYGMAVDSNGKLWATDNGGNFGYGDVSTSCTTQKNFGVKQFDELNLIEPGKFYGHPNRNRKQCVFGAGTVPKAVMVSSTTGVTEYTANIFRQQLKNHLILSKYSASGSGVTWESAKNGDNISLNQMTEYSGLAVVTGLYGELIMPRVQQAFIAVLKPKYLKPSVPFVIAVSPRRGYSGGQVFVSGENFAAGMSVKFGSATAQVVKLVGTVGCFVKVPNGSGTVSVQVTVGGVKSEIIPGGDFIYEK